MTTHMLNGSLSADDEYEPEQAQTTSDSFNGSQDTSTRTRAVPVTPAPFPLTHRLMYGLSSLYFTVERTILQNRVVSKTPIPKYVDALETKFTNVFTSLLSFYGFSRSKNIQGNERSRALTADTATQTQESDLKGNGSLKEEGPAKSDVVVEKLRNQNELLMSKIAQLEVDLQQQKSDPQGLVDHVDDTKDKTQVMEMIETELSELRSENSELKMKLQAADGSRKFLQREIDELKQRLQNVEVSSSDNDSAAKGNGVGKEKRFEVDGVANGLQVAVDAEDKENVAVGQSLKSRVISVNAPSGPSSLESPTSEGGHSSFSKSSKGKAVATKLRQGLKSILPGQRNKAKFASKRYSAM